jgi:hypothetical protein
MIKRYGVIGEGEPDHIIIRNILYGFFGAKDLDIRKLFPIVKDEGGFHRIFKYIGTKEFRDDIDNLDFCVIQIDTDECQQWEERIQHIGNDSTQINEFFETVKQVLINRIGESYPLLEEKIIFAITIHDLECWLLPFHATNASDKVKLHSCKTTMNRIASEMKLPIAKGSPSRISNFQSLSKDMSKNKILLEKHDINPSLKIFIDSLSAKFPPAEPINEV